MLSNLGRIGSPLLRYRTGDLVERGADGPCACGSYEMALPGGILARADDMLVVRGVNVYPSAVEEILRSCDGVAEYRVEIHTGHPLPELHILVESKPECSDVAGYVKGVAERIGEHIKMLDQLEEVTTRLMGDQARVSDSTDEARLLSEQAKAKLLA